MVRATQFDCCSAKLSTSFLLSYGPQHPVAEIWRFFDFSKWLHFAILDLLRARLDQSQRAFGNVYHCAKFGWNRCSSIANMKILIFITFGLKTPIHAPKMHFWGFGPVNGQDHQRRP